VRGHRVLRNVPLEGVRGVACCFLDAATGRCSIHEDRPLVCRLFPVGCHRCVEIQKSLQEPRNLRKSGKPIGRVI
jgi:Fe-S-cluster containining protein